MFKFCTKNLKDTRRAAKTLAEEIRKKPPRLKQAMVLGLVGELGAGKTVFAQAFIRALGVKTKITSPTFVIIKKYKISHRDIRHKDIRYKTVFHIDAYRLRKSKELLDLGFKEIINDFQNIVVIEWADRIRDILPRGSLRIDFRHGKNVNARMIKFRIY